MQHLLAESPPAWAELLVRKEVAEDLEPKPSHPIRSEPCRPYSLLTPTKPPTYSNVVVPCGLSWRFGGMCFACMCVPTCAAVALHYDVVDLWTSEVESKPVRIQRLR